MRWSSQGGRVRSIAAVIEEGRDRVELRGAAVVLIEREHERALVGQRHHHFQHAALGVQPRHENAELPLVAGSGQRRTPHVILDVEVLVCRPRVQRVVEEPGRAQLLVPRRVHHRLGADLFHPVPHEVRPGVGRHRERKQPADMHHRLGCLAVKEHRIQGVQPRHHCAIVLYGPPPTRTEGLANPVAAAGRAVGPRTGNRLESHLDPGVQRR